jgi:hypothetical protein
MTTADHALDTHTMNQPDLLMATAQFDLVVVSLSVAVVLILEPLTPEQLMRRWVASSCTKGRRAARPSYVVSSV